MWEFFGKSMRLKKSIKPLTKSTPKPLYDIVIPVVPHKAVAEVSKIGNL